MDLGLNGKSAVVTGASHGLGRATATALSREGVRVAICGRHEDTIEKAAKEISAETGNDVFPFIADVSKKGDIETFVTAAIDRFDGVDILVNNADADRPEADFLEISDEHFLEKYSTKVLAHVRSMRLVIPGMQARGWGRIIAVGGGSSRSHEPTNFTKGPASAALISLMKKVAVLYGPDGITLNVIEPGQMWTDGPTRSGKTRTQLRQAQLDKKAEEEGISKEEMEARFLSERVIGRRVTAEDAAGVILFLSSNLAGTITGEVTLANGGECGYVRF